MSGVPWPTAGFRVRSVLACTLGAALLASSKPSEQSRIGFENRQEHSGVTFVLNNGSTDDKPIIDSTLGGVALLDYDNDGILDIFVTNYLDWSPENSRVCGPPGKRLSCPPSLYKGEPNILYHNNGDGTFTDVSAATGIAKCIGKGMGVAIADYDGDGW